MSIKISTKNLAIDLRRNGESYSEIIKKVPVAKSTLSQWLRDVGLAKRQSQRLTEKKRQGQLRGALSRKNNRIRTQNEIYSISKKEIGLLSSRELWLFGIALYWAEGSKEKEYQPGSGVKFSNSDSRMIEVFIRWLIDCCGVSKEKITFDIYVHVVYKNRLNEIKKHWSEKTKFPISQFDKIYFKKHNIKTKRKNIGNLYNGLLRVNVMASSELNRRIAGWIMGVSKE